MKLSRTAPALNSRGFSLAEIMIVLVIIGGIMALILPKIIEGQEKNKIRQSEIKMADIEVKLSEYEAGCGKLPPDLNFMVKDTDCQNWTASKSASNLLKDGWNNEFFYEVLDRGYNLKSLGADKKEGGTEGNKDIYSKNSAALEEIE